MSHQDLDPTSRPPSVAPPSGTTLLGPRCVVEPIARRPERRLPGDQRDPPALVSALRARMRNALARGDSETEAIMAARLCRHLLSVDSHLDEAVTVGRRAITLRPKDDELRSRVADALRALGEPGLAAAILRPVVDAACARGSRDGAAADEAVDRLITLGDLLLRAGDVDGAVESFRYVAVIAPERPDGQERLAIARGIAPDAISSEVAARAYIGAAKKHQLADDDARALEALARAFEIEPRSSLAANVLADALEDVGRVEAADAVRAEHARAVGDNLEAAGVVHLARREKARLRGDRVGVVATVLDELVELCHRTEPGAARDALRSRLDVALEEIPELAHARRRVHALLSVGREALDSWRSIARTATTPEQRLEAYAEIIARDLTDEAALAAMREDARLTHDPTAVIDALIRGLRGDISQLDPASITARSAELAGWADEQVDDPALAAWAWQRVLSVVPGERRARDELARLAPRIARADAQLAEAEALGESRDLSARAEGLRRELRAIFGRPEREAEVVGTVEDLLEAAPEDPAALVALERLARRSPADEGRFALELRERVTSDPAVRGAARRARVESALRRGDVEGAIGMAGSSTEPEVAPTLVALALRLGRGTELGHALARFAYASSDRSTVLAAASRACRMAARIDDARTFAEGAVREGPRDLRAAMELADLACAPGDVVAHAVAGPVLERALAGLGPRVRWAIALARIADAAGEAPMSAGWSRRAWSLRPGDLEIAALWLQRAVTLQDPEVIAEVVRTTSAFVASLAPLSPEIGVALRTLFNDDPRIADQVARELLAIGAARLAPIREAILAAPTVTPELVIAVHERWLASGAAAADRPRVLLTIADTARAAGQPSRAADAAERVLAEPEVDEEGRNRARRVLLELADAMLDADGELAVRKTIAEMFGREALDVLDHAPRARLTSADDDRLAFAADAHRMAGRDLWDLADDRDGALRAWLAGARLLGGDGLERLEADIAHFGGDEAARDALFELARREDMSDEPASPSAARRARIESFRLRAWERLLAQPPSWVEPLSLAREAAARATDPAALLPGFEILAQRHQRTDLLPELYEITAGRTAGRFGMRAVHYRAARILDRLGNRDEALDHAVRAFSAVPSEGAMLMMLERLARGSRRADVAIAALVEAADQADDAEKKTIWLDRAAAIGESDALPAEERVDLLLRLFLTAPSARSIDALTSSIRSVVASDTTLGETWSSRLLRAYRRIAGEIGWSQRVAVVSSVARTVADLGSLDGALDLLGKAAAETPRADLDPLRTVAEELGARDPEIARAWLDRGSDGPLHAHIAWASGDVDRAIGLLAAHAPESDSFDLGDGDGSPPRPPREIELLELWAPAATDKALVARAWERFGKQRGPAAELEAAKALDEAGQTEEAARLLIDAWRARDQASPEVLREILQLAHAILPQASADAALIDMLVDDLQANEGGDLADRVARWRHVAELRATRIGDRPGALDALVEAGRIAPADDDLWNEIGDLAEAIGAHERLTAALAQRLQRARPEKRVALLRKLSRVLEHDLNRDDEAAERWAELVRLLPLDAEAADALERIAERRGDGAQLLDLLRARASRLPIGHAERTRALRRVARELGGLPGRRGEVLAALREVHQQNPGDLEVALQLASLARSAGDLGTAAEALMRAFRSATRESARVHLAIEAARVLLELHDNDTAARLLHEAATNTTLETEPRALDLLRLQLEVAIARSDLREEALARIRLAELDVNASPDRRASNASAAARALLSLGELPRARELAWRAARAAPGEVSIASLLVELEFGAGSRTRHTAAAEDGELLGLLLAIPHQATAPADALAMVAFARAELLDLARGAGSGYQDLNLWPDDVRARAPVQLALAERLAAEWSFSLAAAAYERAFAGELHGVRALGPAALAAADAAARSNDPTRAKAFLDLAARDPECRIDARRRAVELARAVGDVDGAMRGLERLAAEGTGNVRAQALADQARLLQPRDREAAAEALRLALAASEEGTALREELLREREALEGGHATRSLPPAPPPSLRDSGITSNRATSHFEKALSMMGAAAEEQAPPPAWIAPQSESEPPPSSPEALAESVAPPHAEAPSEPDVQDTMLSEHPRLTMVGEAPGSPYRPRSMPALPRTGGASAAFDLAALDKIALDPSAPAPERVRALKTLGEAAQEGAREDEATRHFISALELGDIAAGDQAAELLVMMPGRASDLLLVRRRQAFLAPGDRTLLDAVHHAALAVRDLVFARAIDHVRRAFDPIAGPVPPPALDAQLDRPDLVVPLLERRANAAAAEALRLTWEHASVAFRRNAVIPSGTERVTAAVPLGRTVIAAGRLLGVTRTPVYLRQRPGRDVEIVLVTPPALLLGGDCREDTAEVRYVLGAGMIAAHPAHCLLLAQSEESARATWQALLSAFGPPDHGRNASADASRLAATLWQSIPRAAQRRLGELLGQNPPGFDSALEGARQVARRSGLYLSGDLGAAVRSTLSEIGEAQAVAGPSPDLAALCQEHSKVADLFRLATSPEFAEARWRAPSGPRQPGST